MKIILKFTILFVLIGITPVIVITSLGFVNAENLLKETGQNRIYGLAGLDIIADLKVDKIELFFEERTDDISTSQDYFIIKTNLPIITKFANDRTHPEYLSAKKILDEQLRTFQKVYEYYNVILTNSQGKIVYVTNEKYELLSLDNFLPDPDGTSFEEGKKGIFFSEIFRNPIENNNFSMLITAPIRDFDGNFIGVVSFVINMEPIYEFIQDTTGLGETGETLIGINKIDHALFLNPLRHDRDAALQRTANFGEVDAYPIQEATQGREGIGFSIDYRGNEVLAAWKPIQIVNWGLVAKIDKSEFDNPTNLLREQFIMVGAIIIILSLLASFYFSFKLSNPILKLKKTVDQISAGNLDVVIDIKTNDELSSLGNSFNEMTMSIKKYIGELKQSDKTKTLFLNNLTHELKTPLVPIQGNLEMLKDPKMGDLNEMQKESIDEVYEHTTHILNTVESFLKLQKIIENKLGLNIQKMNVSELNEKILEIVSEYDKQNIKIETSFKKNLVINADKSELFLVIKELIKNAIDFLPENNGKIIISANEQNKNVIFSVKDNGKGIAKEKNIFKPFIKADMSHSRTHNGIGLGLSICKGVIEGMGGKIWLESEEGKGSTFFFTIPKPD